jgi:Ca2+-binding RTX toxin-like protein
VTRLRVRGIEDVLGSGDGDVLLGGRGNDVLRGSRGDDLLDGGAGRNRNDGGPGADTCRNPASGPGCEQSVTPGE